MKPIIIKRTALGIGWISGINFWNEIEDKPIKLRSYNGCLCFMIGKKRLGYNSWKELSVICNMEIKINYPF